jgi:hypothetical protein
MFFSHWGRASKELIRALAAAALLHLSLHQMAFCIADILFNRTPLPIEAMIMWITNTVLAHRELAHSVAVPIVAVKHTLANNV